MNDKIKILNEAKDILDEARRLGYGTTIDAVLNSYNTLTILGLAWGDKISIPNDFAIYKGKYGIANSATNYVLDKDTYYIHWDNGNIGRYQFVSGDMEYDAVGDEWKEFMTILMSYNPVDYDPLNCHMVFTLEDGKRLMADYYYICKATAQKMFAKIKQVQFEKAKMEYEKLSSEVKELVQ